MTSMVRATTRLPFDINTPRDFARSTDARSLAPPTEVPGSALILSHTIEDHLRVAQFEMNPRQQLGMAIFDGSSVHKLYSKSNRYRTYQCHQQAHRMSSVIAMLHGRYRSWQKRRELSLTVSPKDSQRTTERRDRRLHQSPAVDPKQPGRTSRRLLRPA
jgi:hypothetical protein